MDDLLMARLPAKTRTKNLIISMRAKVGQYGVMIDKAPVTISAMAVSTLLFICLSDLQLLLYFYEISRRNYILKKTQYSHFQVVYIYNITCSVVCSI